MGGAQSGSRSVGRAPKRGEVLLVWAFPESVFFEVSVLFFVLIAQGLFAEAAFCYSNSRLAVGKKLCYSWGIFGLMREQFKEKWWQYLCVVERSKRWLKFCRNASQSSARINTKLFQRKATKELQEKSAENLIWSFKG